VLADHYGVDIKRGGKRVDTSWYDGLRDGVPWEFKATAHRHADGNPGNFKIYKVYHSKLRQQGGWYGFAVYRKRGTGTQVLKMKAVPASKLPLLRWHGGGSHRGSKQGKLAIDDVF